MRHRWHLRFIQCVLVSAVGITLSAATQVQPPPSAGSEFEWRFSLQPNQVVSSRITAENKCRRKNRFEIDPQHLPSFMRLAGDSSFNVDANGRHDFPVQFDSAGLSPGRHEGLVIVNCVTCQKNGCHQDRRLLHIYMMVQEENTTQFVPNRILAAITFDSSEKVEAIARKLAAAHGLAVVEIHELNSIHAALIVFMAPTGSDVPAKVEELLPEVLLAQPDYLYRTTLSPDQENGLLATLHYGPKLIHADRLHGVLTGKSVRVAIIDTGADVNHPRLKGKITEQLDTTARGFTPDIHGTMLAGIVAGQPDNSGAILGIAPNAEILAIKACQPETPQAIRAQCWSLTLAQGLDLAIQKQVRIINFSLSGPKDKLLARLIDEAVNRGMVVIAAAGNDGPRGQPSYPAAWPKVIAVTAVDANEQLYPEATQGDYIALAAPGVEIVSTSPGGKLMVSSGTSFAAAFVTGTAALVLEQQSQLSPVALQSLLERTAKDLGPPGRDPQFGSGLLDACQAVAQLKGERKFCQ